MSKIDPLLELVHSLTPHEKRYFRLFAGQHVRQNQSVYLTLFDVISTYQVRTEEDLRKRVEEEHFAKHLSATKNQLRSLLLKALRNFHAEATASSKLRAALENIEVLYRRGLYRQCRSELKRANKLLDKDNNYRGQLELFDWEQRLLILENDKSLSEDLTRLKDQGAEIKQSLARRNRIKDVYYALRVASSIKPRTRTQEEQEEVDRILADLPEATPGDMQSELLRQNAVALHHFISGRIDEARSSYRDVLDGFEVLGAGSDWDLFVNSAANYLNCCLLLKDYVTFQAELEKVSSYETDSPHATVRLQSMVLYHALNHQLNFGTLANGKAVIARIKAFLREFDHALHSGVKLNFVYNGAMFFFLHGCYKEAIAELNVLLDMGKGELRSDIRQFAHILLMMIHFDLNNLSLIDYLHRNTYRRFKMSDKLLWYEQDLLQFLKKNWPEGETDVFRETCKALMGRLQAKHEASNKRKPAGLQEVLYWLDSKSAGVPLAEYYEGVLAENRTALKTVG